MSVIVKYSLLILVTLNAFISCASVSEMPSTQQVESEVTKVSDAQLNPTDTLVDSESNNHTELQWSEFVPPVEPTDSLWACMRAPCTDDNETLLRIEMDPRVPKTIAAGTPIEIGCKVFGAPTDAEAILHWKRPNATPIWTESLSYDVKRNSDLDTTNLTSPKLVEGTLKLYNLTALDSGHYSCFVTLPKQCCYRKTDLKIFVYKKASYDADLVIVAAIAFVEVVAILTLKTWQKRVSNSEKESSYPHGANSDLQYTPLKVLSYKEIERKPEDPSANE